MGHETQTHLCFKLFIGYVCSKVVKGTVNLTWGPGKANQILPWPEYALKDDPEQPRAVSSRRLDSGICFMSGRQRQLLVGIEIDYSHGTSVQKIKGLFPFS